MVEVPLNHLAREPDDANDVTNNPEESNNQLKIKTLLQMSLKVFRHGLIRKVQFSPEISDCCHGDFTRQGLLKSAKLDFRKIR